MRPSLILCSLLLSAVCASAQNVASGGVLIEAQSCFDVEHYRLEIRVDPDQQRIDGQLTMRAVTTDETEIVVLDLDRRLKVEGLRLDDGPVEWHREGDRIRIVPDPPLADDQGFEVVVDYGGEPPTADSPPWDGGFTWAHTRGGEPWIATSCQGQGADLWWPCKDHPSDKSEGFELVCTVPDSLTCASNGVLLQITPADPGWHSFHWRTELPISSYCVALNIAPYRVIEDNYTCVDGTELPVFFYVLPEHAKRAAKALPEFLDHMRHLEETLGPYPFRSEKYALAETPFLGMEHQTIIAYGNGFKRGAFDFDWLHYHELSHEWWGNLVTCRDWKDMWIHEGLGTYMQALYLEQRHGRKAYHLEMDSKRRMIVGDDPLAPRESCSSQQIQSGGRATDIYYKGSWVVHSLRWLLGDEAFFRALRRLAYPDPALEALTDGSPGRHSDSDEVQAIVERESGLELGWFFELYLRQAELPELRAEEAGGVIQLSWIVPAGLPFPMPVPVHVGKVLLRVEVGADGGSFEPAGEDWEIDPDRWLLRR